MVRKNCNSNRSEQFDLLGLQSGHSENKSRSFFSVVSSKIRFFSIIFNICYILGLKAMYLFQNMARFFEHHCFSVARVEFEKITKKAVKKTLGHCFLMLEKLTCFFVNAKEGFKNTFEKMISFFCVIIQEYKKDKSLKSLRKLVFVGLKNNKKSIFRFANYVCPVVGILVLTITINIVLGFEYGLEVDCFGKNIGCVEDEYVFLSASKQMNSIINYSKDQLPINDTPRYTLVRLGKKVQCDKKDDIAQRLLKASHKEKTICKASGLYINDDLVCVVKTKKSLEDVFDKYLEPYKKLHPNSEVSFVDDVVIKDGYYLTCSVCKGRDVEESIRTKVNRGDQEQIVYTVRKGDVPLAIARNNNISYEQLKQLNPDIEQDLKPGKEVVLNKTKPLLSVKVEETQMVEEKVSFETETIKDVNIPETYCKIIQAGREGVIRKEYKTICVDGKEVGRELVSETWVVSPVNQKCLVGAKPRFGICGDDALNSESVDLCWPVPSGKISCGWYGYKGHIGVDFAASSGSLVVAAESGIVIFSGWQGAYGNCVLVKHANNIVTRYAHNSKNLVSVGETVSKGQTVALVGQTGNAYGSHCHFEVIVSGVPKNPMLYVGQKK